MKKLIKISLGVLAGILILMQFFRIDKTNPPIDSAITFQQIEQPPTTVSEILKTSCYDCHSHQTEYPWYSNIAPVSLILQNHIVEGREHLNFSTWGNYPASERSELLEEAIEEIEENKMPLYDYLWLHADAKLTASKKAELINWLKGNKNLETSSHKSHDEEREDED